MNETIIDRTYVCLIQNVHRYIHKVCTAQAAIKDMQ